MKLITTPKRLRTTETEFKSYLETKLNIDNLNIVWDIWDLIKRNTTVKLDIPDVYFLNNTLVSFIWVKEDIYFLQCNIINNDNIQFLYLNKHSRVLEFTNYERVRLTKSTLTKTNLLFINEILNVRVPNINRNNINNLHEVVIL